MKFYALSTTDKVWDFETSLRNCFFPYCYYESINFIVEIKQKLVLLLEIRLTDVERKKNNVY